MGAPPDSGGEAKNMAAAAQGATNHRFLSAKAIRGWYVVHKWTSLICTAFMLLLCVTGLPLIFHEEIDDLSGDAAEAPVLPAGTPVVSLDRVAAAPLAGRPEAVVRYLFWDSDEHPDITFVGVAPSTDAPPDSVRYTPVDTRTGAILKEAEEPGGFLYVMLKLHVDLFAGLPGTLFLGFMGLLLVVATVSGVVLYAPFMRRLPFGTVRRDRTARTKWLDMHNMLGMVTLVWVLVVGATGTINTCAQLLFGAWRNGQLAEMVAPYRNVPPLKEPGSIDRALVTARAAAPDRNPRFVAYPGTPFSSKHHFAVFMNGNTPLTARLVTPALIDARTGELTDMRALPWYLTALLVSQPLHFGDYGGLPMKIIWAALDILTIVILGSGLYLWVVRRKGAGQPAADASDVDGQEQPV
jgi:uncharacterized iron-regulated membrane protein